MKCYRVDKTVYAICRVKCKLSWGGMTEFLHFHNKHGFSSHPIQDFLVNRTSLPKYKQFHPHPHTLMPAKHVKTYDLDNDNSVQFRIMLELQCIWMGAVMADLMWTTRFIPCSITLYLLPVECSKYHIAMYLSVYATYLIYPSSLWTPIMCQLPSPTASSPTPVMTMNPHGKYFVIPCS